MCLQQLVGPQVFQVSAAAVRHRGSRIHLASLVDRVVETVGPEARYPARVVVVIRTLVQVVLATGHGVIAGILEQVEKSGLGRIRVIRIAPDPGAVGAIAVP